METYIVTVDGTAYEVTVQKNHSCSRNAHRRQHPHTRRQKSQKSLLLP